MGVNLVLYNKEVLFELEAAAMSFCLTGSDFQDRIAKLFVLLTLQNAVSSAVGAVHALTSNLTTSPLVTMEKACDK